ncbi:MAG TPA: shikimate kinase [Armatimonadota bacterium]|jgi:shikimate kinase
MIFIIGPGGVGKTTAGRQLAELMGRPFVDLDAEFCAQIANIGAYHRVFGHAAYRERNARLAQLLVERGDQRAVMATSSGFLDDEPSPEIAERNARLLCTFGASVLLLPSLRLDDSASIIVARQMGRGFGLDPERERAKFLRRFPVYRAHGDVQVSPIGPPAEVARRMRDALAAAGLA